MSKKQKLGGLALVILILLLAAGWHIHDTGVAVFQPRGTIGSQEKSLIITALLLSLIVVIPVYAMLVGFAWRYREGNKKARYQPDFDHSALLESIWWGVPLTLITILGFITWRSSHQLDPFKALDSPVKPISIQVVAMQWKWLFIYPDQNIASVNYVQIPVNTPVRFEITSDAPMNSFWIPQLGGQIYAMSGMKTDLNLEATQEGSYQGVSANISGQGFAGMRFTAQATSEAAYKSWLANIKGKTNQLTASTYSQLARPSQNDPVKFYGSAQAGLFDSVVDKYLSPLFITPQEAK